MRYILFVFIIIFLGCNSSSTQKDSLVRGYSIFENTVTQAPINYSTYNKQAADYCKENNFNEEYYFLLDYSIHSGKNRFFIVDLKTDSIIDKQLVTHGACDVFEENPDKWEKAKFSNQVNSHCSSIGKYKVGNRDISQWGIKVKYWLIGLEAHNNKAEERVVVLHSWNAVSDEEIYPENSPLSWGCPAVSNSFMTLLDEKLQQTKKPTLLWIIESEKE